MKRALWIPMSLAALIAGCGSETKNDPGNTSPQQARVRNAPPAYCTDSAMQECPPLEPETCADGTEPVIDYDSSCCPHFTCQNECPAGAVAVGCDGWPAPSCPPGTNLWIGTDEQCCALYRCAPNGGGQGGGAGGGQGGGTGGFAGGGMCDPSIPVPCPAAFPYCGEGVEPVVIGEDENCCPIYQCPCDGSGAGGFPGGDLPPLPPFPGDPTDPSNGGMGPFPGDPTDPMSGSGGSYGGGWIGPPDRCGCTYPTCLPNQVLVCEGANVCGYPCECKDLEPPTAGECTSDADCEMGAKCNVDLCLPGPGCDDPNTACPAVCYGKCEVDGGVVNGCGGDADCGPGLACQISCWGDSSGREECAGQCVPVGPTCDPMNSDPRMCAQPDCANPVPVGFDEQTCCPIWECGSACTPGADGGGRACQVPECQNPTFAGVGPDCCPIACCPIVNPDGTLGVRCTGA